MKKPNAETQAAMTEAQKMIKARFATPKELFDSLDSKVKPVEPEINPPSTKELS